MAAAGTTAPPRRSRKRLWIALALLLAALIGLRWVSRPSQVGWIVLSQTGRALGLEISASGASEYRLRGTPMLEVRDLVARVPGSDTPLLRAGRVYLAVPWTTIRAAGASLDVERVELDAPQLDLGELQRWLASRPASTEPLKLPRLSRGARVRDGRVAGEGWSVQAIGVEFAELDPDKPVRGRLRGRALADGVEVPFDLYATLQRPAAARGLGLAGAVAVQAKDWRLPMRVRAGARLHAGDDGLGLDALRLGANARYRAGSGADATALAFAFGVAGPLRYRDGDLSLAPMGAALRAAADSAVPNLDAGGRFGFGQALHLHWRGRIQAWPQAWPALPPPLGQSAAPLSFQLDYDGKADFSDSAELRTQREQTVFEGRFRLPQVLAWIDAKDGPPLPPLAGRLSTPKIEISGATLEGVEVQIEDDPPAAAPAPAS
ncbi:hypothetical protein SAMN04487939_101851 [Lysobacter sp. yr284]|uniref:hypothetical protein n=1 Tax=Lysobacter sp. yr284 TaxID=1761791 RepID=UPI0008948D6B|nr:hypothetical protein [Lysobacter sp. yr284]SDY32828.1 hypothetical protein SAMN04487939_101851 [Lysobacter sp. yr284]